MAQRKSVCKFGQACPAGLSMANSAALNPGGKPVTELRAAVTRLGFDALRAAAVGFAMAQLRRAKAYAGIARHLNVLWQHSVLVASLCCRPGSKLWKYLASGAMLIALAQPGRSQTRPKCGAI